MLMGPCRCSLTISGESFAGAARLGSRVGPILIVVRSVRLD